MYRNCIGDVPKIYLEGIEVPPLTRRRISMIYLSLLGLCNKTIWDFRSVNVPSSVMEGKSQLCWQKPDEGWIKINTDAGNFQNGSWGLGVVGRDNNGDIIVAGHVRKRASPEIICAEAEAVKWGLELARDCSLNQIVIESDNSALIAAFCNNGVFLNELGDILNEIRNLAIGFEQVLWKAVPRIRNQLAHDLAKEAAAEDEFIWIEDIPELFQQKWLEEKIRSCELSGS
ncbi:uncharacterized protein LOC126664453 [Mercurialis annua]|uniref:uncharacterized protein LOC126664453 n=1 Tax=Mercurialis annua TaxID=3986 RepID=UPI00215E1F16|nr:uncharacterized protein LOC126664453 [Mercurialis annua]